MTVMTAPTPHPAWCEPQHCFREVVAGETAAVYHRSPITTLLAGGDGDEVVALQLLQVTSADPNEAPAAPVVAWGDLEITVDHLRTLGEQLVTLAAAYSQNITKEQQR